MTTLKQRVIATECAQFMGRVQRHFNSKVPEDIGKRLRILQSQQQQFLQTWSAMAGRNMLNEMLRTLVALETKLTGDAKTAALDLKNGIGRQLATHNVTKARYDTVLCLGYKVKTGGSYKGKADDYADMEAKCRDMIDAIRSAYNLCGAAAHNDGRMLKVFMAPEFFFRGINGGYDFDDVMGLAPRRGTGGVGAAAARKGLLEIMQAEISKPVYKDWLFVLGTVIVLSANTEMVCTTCLSDDLVEKVVGGVKKLVCKVNNSHPLAHSVIDAHVDNVAYVCKESEVYTVSKELVSGIDFKMTPDKAGLDKVRVRGVTTRVERNTQPSRYDAASEKPSTFQDERMGGSIFTIDGVTFGLEVCLDHAAATAKKSKGRLDHAGNIQINLIPSAGMKITRFRTVPDGVVFNVDGAYPHVQVVGRKNGSLWLIADRPADGMGQEKTTAIETNKWLPEEMAPVFNPRAPEHNPATNSRWKTEAEKSGPAPRGKVVAFGPFMIPRA